MLLLLAACKAKPAGEAAPAPASAPVDLADPLALVPADSDMIVKLDLAALRTSSLWRSYQHEALVFLAPSFASCDYNPLDEITTITAGIPMASKQGVFVIRGVDRDKATKCLHASTPATNTTVTFDGDFITLTNKSGAVNMLTFVDARTLVMQGSKNPTKQSLTAALRIGAPLRNAPAVVAAVANLSRTAALTFVSRPGSESIVAGLRANFGMAIRGFSAALEATDRLELHTVVDLTTAADAAAMVANAQAQIAEARTLFESITVKADGPRVLLDISVTEARLKALVDLAKTMMPE